MFLTRDKQFGIKIEATNGTKETLAVGDFGLQLSEVGSTLGVDSIENQVFQGSLSATTNRIGKKTAGFTIAGEFKNSGVLNTKPKIDAVLQAARMVPTAVKAMAVSAVTNTAQRGVTVITGGTSGAKGIYLKIESTTLFYIPISGTFVSADALTGTGFVATAGTQDAVAKGWVYMPATAASSEKSATVYVYDGGIAKSAFGMVANFGLELGIDSYPKFTSTLTGVLDSAVWGTAGTKQSNIVFESHMPPVVNNAVMKIGGTVAPIASKISLDLGNALYVIPDLNSANWLKYGVVTARSSTGTLSILALDPAVYSAYQALFAGGTAEVVFEMGAVSGNKIEVIMPAVQYTGVGDGDSNGFLSSELSLKLTGTDNELIIWFR